MDLKGKSEPKPVKVKTKEGNFIRLYQDLVIHLLTF
jgi:hypothetical protein